MLDMLQKIPERYLDDTAFVEDVSENNNPTGRKFSVIQVYEDINSNCDYVYTVDIDSEDWIEGDD